MIQLYHCDNARSFRALWALEETGLAYELHQLPFPPRVRAKEYLGINPLGTVPLLIDGPVRMTESAAIGHYLAARYRPELALAAGDEAFGAFLEWTHFGEATLAYPLAIALRYDKLEAPERRHADVAADHQAKFLGRLTGVEAALDDGREYLVGGRFTVADISVGYALLLAKVLGLAGEFPEGVAQYWTRLSSRERYGSAVAAQRAARAGATR